MTWNTSFYVLGYNEKFVVLFDGSNRKTYGSPVQYSIVRSFFGQEEVSLDQLGKTYKGRYSLQEMLDAFYGFVKDKVLFPLPLLKVSIESPEAPSIQYDIEKLTLRNCFKTC